MTLFKIGKTKYWVGIHKTIGCLIYDESIQSGLSKKEVRLFKCATRELSNFKKAIVKEKLLTISGQKKGELRRALDSYLQFKTNKNKSQRNTHCFSCKRVISSSNKFRICKKCKWMVCTCGACGCDYIKAI